MLPVNSVLPRIVFAPYAPPIICHLCISNSLPSILVVSKKNILRSSFVRHPVQLIRGNTFALPAPPLPPIPNPNPPNGKNSFLGCFALFQSSFSIHYHYSILRSSFFVLPFLGISKTDPYHSCPPPVGLVFLSCVRACGWRYGLVWVQTVWINRLLTFSLQPYYIICLLLAIVCTSSSSRPFLV